MSETHSHSAAYVRREMLAEQAPPITESGAVKWVRENLLSTPMNIALTVISLYIVWGVLSAVVPWFINSVWNARSLSECREVFLVEGATGGGGACWAVLQERGIQLIYGFYPADLYWRPNLAFLLFFVAMAPVLYSDRVPRQMLWFTAVYPFLMPWLLWGGAFWVPLLAIAGFVVGYVAWRLGSLVNGILGTIAAIVVAVLWWIVALPPLNDGLHRLSTETRTIELIAEAETTVEVLPPQIAAQEAEREELRARVTELETVKAEAFAPIEAAVETAREEAVAAYFAEEGIDPESDEIGPSVREEARHAAQVAASEAARAQALDPQRQTFESAVAELTDLRNQINALSSQINLSQNDLSEAQARLQNLREMPAWQERQAELRATLPTLEDELPAGLREVESVADLPPGTDPESRAAFEAVMEVRDELATLQNVLSTTYRDAGRIGLEPVEDREFGGFMLALIIGLSGIILSLPLGILLALGRQSDLFIVNKICIAFIEVIRGVPLIVWLFTAQLLLNYFLPPGTNFSLLLRVIIMVTFFASAYIAEVVRGGLAALPRGQYEAADALGLDYTRAMRLIILPQALKISIPGIVNTFIGLFKDTTLVVFIGLLDPIGLSNTIRASTDWNGIYWELFAFIGLLFFICCYGMSRYSMALERKLTREHR